MDYNLSSLEYRECVIPYLLTRPTALTGSWSLNIRNHRKATTLPHTVLLYHRTYRGQIYVKLGQFNNAADDLSLALHLNPNNWLAFYHRGCLVRKRQPESGIRDLSTSGTVT